VISSKDYLILDCGKLLICIYNFILCIYEVYFVVQNLCAFSFDFQLMFLW
jgi:hypothetical protein